jgi:hypothetical protein
VEADDKPRSVEGVAEKVEKNPKPTRHGSEDR